MFPSYICLRLYKHKFLQGWEEAPRRRNDEFSDWDANRGNGSSRRKNDDDNSSDIR